MTLLSATSVIHTLCSSKSSLLRQVSICRGLTAVQIISGGQEKNKMRGQCSSQYCALCKAAVIQSRIKALQQSAHKVLLADLESMTDANELQKAMHNVEQP